MADAYIIDAVRTPRGIGKPGKGALSHLHPQHLAATVLKALKERNNLDTSTVDDVIWSTSTQKGKQGGDLGRMAALAAGYDVSASGMTLDRFCGGGITSVNEEIVYTPLKALGGSISAEHGIGLEKRDWLALCRSDAEIALMRTLKAAMDPRGILNPGKVLA